MRACLGIQKEILKTEQRLLQLKGMLQEQSNNESVTLFELDCGDFAIEIVADKRRNKMCYVDVNTDSGCLRWLSKDGYSIIEQLNHRGYAALATISETEITKIAESHYNRHRHKIGEIERAVKNIAFGGMVFFRDFEKYTDIYPRIREGYGSNYEGSPISPQFASKIIEKLTVQWLSNPFFKQK